MTLADFLLARIAEDEVSAPRWHDIECDVPVIDNLADLAMSAEVPGVLCDCNGPSRVLAECEAKRTTIAVCTSAGQYIGEHYRMDPDATDVILRALALPYADHPEFREEWRSC